MKVIIILALIILLVSCAKQQEAPAKECSSGLDCVPSSCCHSSSCVKKSSAPDCKGVLCTEECKPGTIDCGGSCSCQSGKCTAEYANASI